MGLQFPISIGEGKTEVCPCLKAAKRSSNELHFFRLPLYPRRNDFDPYNKISSTGVSKYQHKAHLEDFWANAADENEIRKRLHSRLPLNIIRTCNIFKVPDQMEEDPNVMRKGFNPEMIGQLYDWKKKEIIDLEALSKPFLDFTKWWIERKLEKLVAPASGFTYRLLSHRPLRDERS